MVKCDDFFFSFLLTAVLVDQIRSSRIQWTCSGRLTPKYVPVMDSAKLLLLGHTSKTVFLCRNPTTDTLQSLCCVVYKKQRQANHGHDLPKTRQR